MQVIQQEAVVSVDEDVSPSLQEADPLLSIVNVLAAVIEACSSNLALHSRRVRQLAGLLAVRMELGAIMVRNVEYAAQLHDIGHVAGSRAERKLYTSRTPTRRIDADVRCDRIAQKILSSVSECETLARYIRHQHEHYDGSGKPEGLKGDMIPLGSRIIAIADAYDQGAFSRSNLARLSKDTGKRSVQQNAGKQFDPRIVAVFMKGFDEMEEQVDQDAEVELSPGQVAEEMILSRALRSIDGAVLLAENTFLTPDHVERIRSFEASNLLATGVFVQCQVTDAETGQRGAATELLSEGDDIPGGLVLCKPLSVLVVDDSKSMCNAFKRELTRAGFQVVTTESALEALEIVEANSFDVVITDLLMPGMQGDKLVERLGEQKPQLPCVVVTGNATKPRVIKPGQDAKRRRRSGKTLGSQTSGANRHPSGRQSCPPLKRRERDSNPRYGLRPHNGFQDRRLKPLGHPSGNHLNRPAFKVNTSPPAIASEVRAGHRSMYFRVAFHNSRSSVCRIVVSFFSLVHRTFIVSAASMIFRAASGSVHDMFSSTVDARDRC